MPEKRLLKHGNIEAGLFGSLRDWDWYFLHVGLLVNLYHISKFLKSPQ